MNHSVMQSDGNYIIRDRTDQGPIHAFAQALLHTALQHPYDGLRQLANHDSRLNILPNIQLIEPPKQAPADTLSATAQQFGAAFGVALDFFLARKFLGISPSPRARGRLLAGLGSSFTTGFVSGAIYDGIFRPVSEEDDFAQQRLCNALTGAFTFATMGSLELGFAHLGNVQRAGALSLLSRRPIAATAAGIPAGILNSELSAGLAGRGWTPNLQEWYHNASSFAVIGGSLAGLHSIDRRMPELRDVFRQYRQRINALIDSLPPGTRFGPILALAGEGPSGLGSPEVRMIEVACNRTDLPTEGIPGKSGQDAATDATAAPTPESAVHRADLVIPRRMLSAVELELPHLRARLENRESYEHNHRYGYLQPNVEILDALARYGPLIEIGAGNAYWAHILQRMGVDILPFDAFPTDRGGNEYFPKEAAWTEVRQGGADSVRGHGDRTLLLCWPPPNNPMCIDAVNAYPGNRVIFIGVRNDPGITGDAAFNRLLDNHWTLVNRIHIPHHRESNIYMHVFGRTGTPAATVEPGFIRESNLNECRTLLRAASQRLTFGGWSGAAEATSLIGDAIREARTLFRQSDPQAIATIIHEGGDIFARTERNYQEAIRLYRRADRYLTTHSVSDGMVLARCRLNLARALAAQGRPADNRFDNALSLAETTLGPGHPQLIPYLEELGRAVGGHDSVRAEQIWRQVIEIRRSHPINTYEDYSGLRTAWRNLAQILERTNQFAQAESALRSVLEMDSKMFDTNCENVEAYNDSQIGRPTPWRRNVFNDTGSARIRLQESLNELARFLREQGRLAECATFENSVASLMAGAEPWYQARYQPVRRYQLSDASIDY